MYHRHMDGHSPDVAAFILGGGKSTRMGTDKAFVLLDGRTLLQRALDLARLLTSDVRIVGDRGKFAQFAPVVEDVFRDCGPLGGIHAALKASSAELNLILAVDVPFLSTALLEYLIMCARNSANATVAVAQAAGRLQPLCAVYRPQFADAAENSLRSGHYKIDALFAAPHTRIVAEKELESAGFSSSMFRNLNTPGELEAVRNESGGGRNN